MTKVTLWLYTLSALFLAISPPATAQELKRDGAFAPAGDDYIIELRNFDRFLVTEKVGDSDGVGEMHQIRVELSTNAARYYTTQSRTPARAQKHTLVQRTGYWEIRPFDQINRFPHDEVLSVHAPATSQIDIGIIAKERDCVGNRSCGRGDSGRTYMYFEVPTFAVPLPRSCTNANTFKLQTIDNNWHLGPIPMRSGPAGRGGPRLTFDPDHPPSICIRKPGGTPDIHAVLFNEKRGVCARHQSTSETSYKALRTFPCIDLRRLVELTADPQSVTPFYFQNLKKENSFFVSDGPVTFDRNTSTCLYSAGRPFAQDVFTRTAAPSNFCNIRRASEMFWQHGAAHTGSVSNDKGQCLGIGRPSARFLSLETCRDRDEQRWKLAIPYRLYAPWAQTVSFGYHVVRTSAE